ncbi:protein PHLOEM PROTEIN 2-LIKE A10 [Amborella trichopoda]|uniref:Protein PHLOEM PROTEIN 2-LIKE A10 n=1 Tax=Amborella trichopoda TaxID=13333 RepID=U5D7Y7_AMBTC|nr:protein PHLOEM PROTEIN 2-LIKE A10 [Amborella trichopoda]ERN18564.1 hypothetical protein AMTR_s00065p00116550 [Amborella trichopoda]|eukprot:XP_006857097.1 protein PHLOEM PROTEIN 2-LIKE A10 [Amborella trichopoda]
MDLQFLKSLYLSKRRRNWLLFLTACGASGYGAYRLYSSPSITRKRKKLLQLLKTLITIIEATSDSAETIGVVSKDLKEFIQSDSNEVPNSLKQISKILISDEFHASASRVTEALTIGVLRGFSSEKNVDQREEPSALGHSDRLLDKLFTPAGSGFASIVVGSFARNMVSGFMASHGSNSVNSTVQMSDQRPGSPNPKWVTIICNDKSKELIADCIQLFVSTAVAVYLDKTMDINTYDEIFSGLTNPRHEAKVRDMLVSVCNGAVETLVKTSHRVLTSPPNNNSENNASSSSNGEIEDNLDMGSSANCLSTENLQNDEARYSQNIQKQGFEGQKIMAQLAMDQTGSRGSLNSISGTQQNGWIDKVSGTLAVPSNRKFLLDVTGRVTFETVRSFLDFLLWKVSSNLRTMSVMNSNVLERGSDIVRYARAKSIVIATISVALCVHVLVRTGAWVQS